MGNCFKKEASEKRRQLDAVLLGEHRRGYERQQYEHHDILGSITDEHNTVTIAVATTTSGGTKTLRNVISGVSSFLANSINTIKETGRSVIRRNGSSNSNLNHLGEQPPQIGGDASLYLELSRLRQESDKLEKHIESLRAKQPPPSNGATYIGSFPVTTVRLPLLPPVVALPTVVMEVTQPTAEQPVGPVLPILSTPFTPFTPSTVMPPSMTPYAESMLYHSAIDGRNDLRDGHSANTSANNSDVEAVSVADSFLEHDLEGSGLNGSFSGSRSGYSPGPMPPPLPKSLKSVKYNHFS